MKKKYFLIIDTETTQNGLVADFGAVVCDKAGNIVYSIGVLVGGVFDKPNDNPLFFDSTNTLWSKDSLDRRYKAYQKMLDTGQRMLASVPAINRLLVKIKFQYNPILTAYFLSFDRGKMLNTGIDCSMFDSSFCLWHASTAKWGRSKKFRDFVLKCHGFNNTTPLGNKTIQTNAEIMAKFVLGDASMPNEPHTALEDALYYELPILVKLLKNTRVSEYMTPKKYSWKDYQVKNCYRPK